MTLHTMTNKVLIEQENMRCFTIKTDNEVCRLRNLVVDHLEMSLRAMSRSFSIPSGSLEQKKVAVWTKIKKSTRKFDKAKADPKRPSISNQSVGTL